MLIERKQAQRELLECSESLEQAQRGLLELNESLERRVSERTAELATSEARFRAMVEHAPEAITVLDGDTGRFLFGNEHACRLYGVPTAKLTELTPADVSPEFQPCGRRSAELARERIDEALAGGTPIFEWIHRQPAGRLISTEVRLLRLPAEGQNLIRASIIDNTERKSAEQALREANRELHREIEQRTRAEESLKERVRMSTLNAEVAVSLNSGTQLPAMLQQCAELVARHLDVAVARIWTLDPATQTLELQASAGYDKSLDGLQKRVKVGEDKIGLIAREKKPLLTNSVQSISSVSDKDGAAHEEMTGFAGYPLLIEGRVLGVLAMFAQRPLGVDVLKNLGSIADSLVLGIERKRAETALAESEARFSAAFQASPDFIGILRSDGAYVLANDAFLNWLGYPREEVLGHTSAEFGLWEDPGEREAALNAMRTHGSIHQKECRWRNRRGEKATVLFSAETIKLDNIPHVLSFALDITERNQAELELRASEAQLRESETRFSAAFQASPIFIGILRMDDGKFVLVNDALVNWLGCSREEALGQSCADLGMWENLSDRTAVMEELRLIGRIRHRECLWRNRRSERFTVILSAETIILKNAPHVLLLALDITRRKQAEIEVLKALSREKELSQLKSNFVSMVSHEFRTPLGIIQSSAELLLAFYQKMQPDERDEQLESIARNTGRMAGMMEEILVLSRLDAGKLEFQPAALDLTAFCRRVVDGVVSATNRRCSIELSLSSIPLEAAADERLLGHIFTNLLSNAVKYSEPGATVRFELERRGPDAVGIVRDQGVGIPEEDQQKLFTAFHRGANVGSRPGTGLGLMLVKRCAELHGGKVQVASKIGEGTTVVVTLPLFSKEL